MERAIIIDEDLDHRIHVEIAKRGRRAESHRTVGTTNLVDEAVMKKLSELEYPWVLVTGDDNMPFDHAETIESLQATIATVDGEWRDWCLKHSMTFTQDQFNRESIHRWAHVIVSQEQGEIRRYTPTGHSPWKVRPKYARRAAAQRVDAGNNAEERRSDSDPSSQPKGLF